MAARAKHEITASCLCKPMQRTACLTDKLQSIVGSRLSSGGWDAWRFLAISRQASELRKQQIITGSFLWSTGSLRVYKSLTNGTEARERDKFKHT
ncbi:hypothetical protein T4B_5400 [Trichinella pseudospiralis]|uniref:Uncharacterized protein n=1 Tax=Trichinella pseudospiralis TaxID=6337 RepID=A0A0V1J3P2_TRIPS|nr:hypothetical protein T4B_5400 [Trichinella pseudospiralis]